MRTNTRLVLPFFYALLISACSNNDNYPKEYKERGRNPYFKNNSCRKTRHRP